MKTKQKTPQGAKKIRGEGYDRQVLEHSWEAYIPDGKGKYTFVGTFHSQQEAQEARFATLLGRGRAGTGTTLRQWGKAWLVILENEKYRSRESMVNTWRSVVECSPFIDDSLEDLTTPVIFQYVREILPKQKKKRSVLKDGQRSLVELDATISPKYQANAVQLLNQCLDRAVQQGLIPSNPAAGVTVAEDRGAMNNLPSMPYLDSREIELVLSCSECTPSGKGPVSDIRVLRNCSHMPFEKRVVFTLAIHQCPREGEFAALDWQYIDFEREVWHIVNSWHGPTKNGKPRTQGLLPRSMRALRAWWEHQGRPTTGLVFPATGHGPRIGERRAFVDAMPDASEKEVVAAAVVKGLQINAAFIRVARSRNRAKEAAVVKQYAKGYDWGWADSQSTKQGLRPGWWRRCGVQTRIRFHEMRDTCATHLLSGTWGHKWPLKEVSLHLGHSTVTVTEQRYAHLTIEAKVMTASMTESEPSHLVQPRGNLGADVFALASKLLESLAPEAGLEPTTNRLTALVDDSKVVRLHTTPPVFPLCSLATELLERLAVGKWEPTMARKLARSVLSHSPIGLAHEAYTLATEVMGGGSSMIDRATDLAELLRGTNEHHPLLSLQA